MLHAICVQDRAEKRKKESRASGSALLRRLTDRMELRLRIYTTAKTSTSNAVMAVIGGLGNAVILTTIYIIYLDSMQPNRRTIANGARRTGVGTSTPNKHVLDALYGSVEALPAITDSDTLNTRTNLMEVQR